MKARELLASCFPNADLPDREILALTERTDRATPDSIFFCIRGSLTDGHRLAPDAYARGCRIFIAEHPLMLPSDATVLLTDNTRAALSHLAALFYGHPSKRLHVIGITGTKGKTTTAQLLAHILESAGIPTGYIGTNGIRYPGICETTVNTTPDALTLQSTLGKMADAGVQSVVLEVSSQALMQERVRDVHFTSVLFTNLSPDHIGINEHPTFAHYRDTKHRLFAEFASMYAFFNTDDPAAEQMRTGCRAPVQISYGTSHNADYRIENLVKTMTSDDLGITFDAVTPNGVTAFSLPLIGTCNASNALSAMAVAAECFGILPSLAADALKTARVAGRSECIALPNGAHAVIDYAHNGESMRQILTSLRAYAPRRLICLFGSVGERSEMRRAELGRAAAQLSDFAVLTSDNPGNEPPEQILSEIAAAFEGSDTPYVLIPDRESAIKEAVRMTKPGDILLLAGKGHETYQLIGRRKIPFCEREILKEACREIPTVAMQ